MDDVVTKTSRIETKSLPHKKSRIWAMKDKDKEIVSNDSLIWTNPDTFLPDAGAKSGKI